jgi:asparagine synthase (glutamine-hydrolysing)
MCGIAGVFRGDGGVVDRTTLVAMTRSLSHRGPDGEGIWIDLSVGLGHRRLAIRDLTDAGHQPMTDDTGDVAVTYNGEIYNDDTLRRELERDFGVRFRTRCDTEIIPYGYRAWGDALFARLEGMFAIALWDRRRRRLVLARDGAGIKPLYYSARDGHVRFGSEIKALLADDDQPRRIDPGALATFLTLGYAGPASSLVDGICQVPPGTILAFEGKKATAVRYWQPRRTGEIRRPDDALEAFLALWPDVIDRHLVSDVPVGILQSGGVDSSLVSLAVARRHGIPLVSATFADHDFDESRAARLLARRIGAEFVPLPVDAAPAEAEERFLDIVYHADGQLADSSCYAALPLAKKFRSLAKVALSGDGADEFFGGYPTYRATGLAAILRPFIPRQPLSRVADGLAGLTRRDERRLPTAEILTRFAAGLAASGGHPHTQWRRILSDRSLAALAGPELAQHLEPGCGLADYQRAIEDSHGPLIDRCLVADQSYYLPADMLVKVDRMSMAAGLEVRVPFLDRRVMDFAGKLHSSLLIPWMGSDKHILRAAAARLGAPAAISGGRKRGFQVPVAKLLRTGLRGLGEELLVNRAEDLAPLLNPVAVCRHWRDHCSGAANHGYGLWALLTLASWRRSLFSAAHLRRGGDAAGH